MVTMLDLAVQFANVSTVLLTAFCKVPQICKVHKAKAPGGVSMRAVMIELTGYMITMSYFIAGRYQLISYLEYPALVTQDVVLLGLLLCYGCREFSPLVLGLYASGLVTLATVMTSGLLPGAAMSLLATSATPISAMSKIVLLRSIISRGSSEGISLLSWFLSAYTCLTRVLTVFVESSDLALLTNFCVSTGLNLALIVVVWAYAPAPKPKEE